MSTFLQSFVVESTWYDSRLKLSVDCSTKEAQLLYSKAKVIQRIESESVDFWKVGTPEAAFRFLNGNPASFDDREKMVVRLHEGNIRWEAAN